jgi:hypothetical protein
MVGKNWNGRNSERSLSCVRARVRVCVCLSVPPRSDVEQFDKQEPTFRRIMLSP